LGRIYDDRGHRMTPSHVRKRGIKYRYYIPSALRGGKRGQIFEIAMYVRAKGGTPPTTCLAAKGTGRACGAFLTGKGRRNQDDKTLIVRCHRAGSPIRRHISPESAVARQADAPAALQRTTPGKPPIANARLQLTWRVCPDGRRPSTQRIEEDGC
jgi:hypothetical protein